MGACCERFFQECLVQSGLLYSPPCLGSWASAHAMRCTGSRSSSSRTSTCNTMCTLEYCPTYFKTSKPFAA